MGRWRLRKARTIAPSGMTVNDCVPAVTQSPAEMATAHLGTEPRAAAQVKAYPRLAEGLGCIAKFECEEPCRELTLNRLVADGRYKPDLDDGGSVSRPSFSAKACMSRRVVARHCQPCQERPTNAGVKLR